MAPRILDALHARPTSFPITFVRMWVPLERKACGLSPHSVGCEDQAWGDDMISKHGKTNFDPFGQWSKS